MASTGGRLRLTIQVALVAAWACPSIANAQANTDPDAFVLTKDIREQLTHQSDQCQSRIVVLNDQVESVTRWSSIFLVAGAAIAGIGSACAGFLSEASSRKIAALVGALGAVVTVLPKTLKDKDTLTHVLSLADGHKDFGQKVMNEIDYFQTNGLKRRGAEYAAARFTDCVAITPPEKIPELPVYEYGQEHAENLIRPVVEHPENAIPQKHPREAVRKRIRLVESAVGAAPTELRTPPTSTPPGGTEREETTERLERPALNTR